MQFKARVVRLLKGYGVPRKVMTPSCYGPLISRHHQREYRREVWEKIDEIVKEISELAGELELIRGKLWRIGHKLDQIKCRGRNF